MGGQVQADTVAVEVAIQCLKEEEQEQEAQHGAGEVGHKTLATAIYWWKDTSVCTTCLLTRSILMCVQQPNTPCLCTMP